MVDYKNVIIAVLTAYIVLDIVAAIMLKRRHPLVFQHLYSIVRKERRRVIVALLLAVAAGAGTYFALDRWGN